MAFTVPDTSPPSTPDKSRSLFSNPSTTPAGPPPSSTASFGRASSSTFAPSPSGSRSNFSFGESRFGQSSNFNSGDSLFSSLSSSKLPPLQNSIFSGSFGNQTGFQPVNRNGNKGGNLKVRNRKPHNLSQMSAASEDWEDEDGEGEEVDEEEFDEEHEDEEENGEVDEEYEDEGDEGEDREEEEYEDDMETEPTNNTFSGSQFGLSNMSFGQSGGSKAAIPQKRIYTNPENAKRAKIDEHWATSSPMTAKAKGGQSNKQSQFPAIARDMAQRTRAAAVTEPGEIVLPTDEYVGELLDKLQGPDVGDAEAAALFSQAVASLTDLWTMGSLNERKRTGKLRPHNRFGPGENASGIEQATAVASLLLRLHHPPPDSPPRRLFGESPFSNSRSLVTRSSANAFTPIPKVLINWLNENHLGSAQEVDALKQMSPNATASKDFWGIVQAGVLRGQFGDMASLLRSADFNYARSALEDGLRQPGYRGSLLQNVQKVVNIAIQMLESSPLNQENDWDVLGFEWAAYRKRVRSALSELEDFAEGESEYRVQSAPQPFEAPNFGASGNLSIGQNGRSITQALRMAESRVPWSVYQGIKTIYETILGETSAITSVAQDWFEATIGLTAWWNGEDGLLNLSDETPQERYLQRLSTSFGIVADSENARYRPDSFNRLHIGVVCVFEGNVKGALGLLETWSLCIAAAVAEIAHEAGWLETSTGPESLPGLSEHDLMVLSYGQDGGPVVNDLTKDDILDSYAYGLANRDKFQHNGVTRKGWQIALEILSRIDDTKRTKERVSELLDIIPVDTIEQVEQVIIMCGDLGFEDEGRKIADTFGDQIMAEAKPNQDCDYGLAMVCYARARSIRKLKEIANSLIAYSLQQSRAWPPDDQLGGQLRSLVKNPKVCLSSIAKVDEDAAGILQFYASGYATLRRFYDLRDDQSKMRPLARKRAAAEALVAVIRSSADSIYGGLYDPDRDSAVLVDNLLSLLGEVLVFVNDSSPSLLSVEQQSIILAAVEDLETVAPRVFAAVQEFFYECLNEYIFEKTGESRKGASSSGLQKSASVLTTSSSFSMVGSEMMNDRAVANGSTTTNDKDSSLVPRPDTTREYAQVIHRGWDWRAGLAESEAGGNGDDGVKPENKLLRILRLKLAKGMVWR